MAENPELGKQREEIGEGYYGFPQGQNVVFNLIGNGLIDIIGLPHKQMDILNYFQAN